MGSGSASKSRKGSKALDEFCRDLCAEARENRLDPVIGRSAEVARVMQILARRRKNNPILLGEPGVGKTAIAEGLASAIVAGRGDDGIELPPFLVGALPPLVSRAAPGTSACSAAPAVAGVAE